MADVTLQSLTFPGLSDRYTIPQGSSVTVDAALSATSENPVQNKVVKAALDDKADTADVPTKTSDLTNDSGFLTSAPVASVNGSTGAVVLDAEDVGAIAAPASASSGQFLVYNGSAWAAMTLATWQGGSY